MANNEKLVWTEVDTDALDGKLGKLLTAMREANKVATANREAFNTAFLAAAEKAGKIPAGHTLLISHNFGKTSVSLVKADQKAKSKNGGSKPKFTF